MRDGLVLGAAALLYGLLILVAADPDLGKVDMGNAPSWVTAGIALAALFFAIRATSTAKQLYDLERRRESVAASKAARAAQADQVAAWVNDPHGTQLTIHNGSSLPIFDVQIEIHGRSGLFQGFAPVDLIRPDTSLKVPTEQLGQMIAGLVDVPGRPPVPEPVGHNDWIRVGVAFRDCAGIRWMRDASGTLHRGTGEINSHGWPVLFDDPPSRIG